MALSDRDAVRLLIGDTDSAQLTDNQVDYFLEQRTNNRLLAAADACDALAAKYARAYDFETDQQSFDRSQMHEQYLAMGARLRARAGTNGAGALSSLPTTKVDGYSDDIDADDVGVSATTNPRRNFYGPVDELP